MAPVPSIKMLYLAVLTKQILYTLMLFVTKQLACDKQSMISDNGIEESYFDLHIDEAARRIITYLTMNSGRL